MTQTNPAPAKPSNLPPILLVLVAALLGGYLGTVSGPTGTAVAASPSSTPTINASTLTTASQSESSPAPQTQEKPMAKQWSKPPEMTIDPNKTYTAKISTTLGDIDVELYPKIAPKHVNSFVFLAKQGFYDGVIFHRVIPGFMVQGGDPTGTGTGGPGYQLPAEFNSMKHTRGVLSAARSSDPNSAGSQFFLMHDTAPHLDGQYTAYGKATSGLEVIDKIATLPTGRNDRPANPPSIKSITITEK